MQYILLVCFCLLILFPLCSPVFPFLSELQVINVSAINRQSGEERRERNCVLVCLRRCPSVQLETRWCLNCPIYTSLWLIRQVLLAWTLPFVHRPTHFTKRTISLPYWHAPLPVYSMCFGCFFFWKMIKSSCQFWPFLMVLSTIAPYCTCTW